MPCSKFRALVLAMAACIALPAQGQAVAEHLSNGTYRISTAALTTFQPVAGLDGVSFLDIRWSTPVESWSPRTDIGRTESFNLGERVRLGDGSRVYRVLTQSGTAFVRISDEDVSILGETVGDGLTSGYGAELAAATDGPWVAFATIGTLGIAPRVYVARTDVAGPSVVDIGPAGGLPGLNRTSLAFAQGALFFTDEVSLWRHDLGSGLTQQVPLPVTTLWIDSEIAVSGDGSTIALRAGDSESACMLVVVSADASQIIPFGQLGPKLPINYQDPTARPGFSLSYDGSLVPYFESDQVALSLFVAENFGAHANVSLGTMDLGALIGIESEIALGEGGNGTGTGPGLVLFLPLPWYGNVAVSVPYSLLQYLLTVFNNGIFGMLSALCSNAPYGSSLAPTVTVEGHFSTGPLGDKFFIMGPQGASHDLVRLGNGQQFGAKVLQGLDTVHETALAGSMLFVRATSSLVPGQATSLFAYDMLADESFDSSNMGVGDIQELTATQDGSRVAWCLAAPTSGTIWLHDAYTGVVTTVTGQLSGGMTWTQAGNLVFATNASLFSAAPGTAPTYIATGPGPISIL